MKKSLLLFSLILAISVKGQIVPDCSDLFFSEYVEGWSQNKAIEIYNPTPNSIDLSNYQVERYSNGATSNTAGGITILTGTLASGDAFVLTNGETDTSSTFGFCDPLLIALGDMAEPNGSYPTPMHMNGNDVIVLTKNGTILDVIGRVGENPSSGAWTAEPDSNFQTGTWWTAQHTLIRKNEVLKGDDVGLDLFNPSLEWDSLPVGTWTNLGSHNCDCIVTSDNLESSDISYLLYPNPAIKGTPTKITSNTDIEMIEILNILGEIISISRENIIYTNKLVKGVYLVKIKFINGKEIHNKLIVK